ncbi:MAG: hypothetical protein JSV00_00940 [bacterium]|nr:MAG: hypothetical protein JSV00_00940 [bacterium]
MITAGPARTSPRDDAGETLRAALKRLRARRAAGRLVHALTTALTADLLLGLTGYLLFALFGFRLGVPHFFELLLLVLVIREMPDLRMQRFALYLDERFALKDRLYSFLWYAEPGRAPEDVRLAHSRECVASLDLGRMEKDMRVRAGPVLPVVLGLSALLTYLSWNADYRPPAITTRVVLERLQGSAGPEGSPGDTQRADTGQEGQEAVDRAPDPDSSSQPGGLGEDAAGAQPESAQAVSPSASSGQGAVSPGGSGAGGQGSSGATASVDLVAPERIDSIPVTDAVSPPGPPQLQAQAEAGFASLPDAKEFLSLIPGHDGKRTAEIDPSVIENFGALVDDHPAVYREQLETYYRELMKWKEQR